MTMDQPGNESVDLTWLAGQMKGRTPAEIAQAVSDLISSGDLRPGARLPTLRMLSEQVGASQGTLAAAWNMLRQQGVISTRRRGGTIVSLPMQGAGRDGRLRDLFDLSASSPDPALVPPLDQALLAGLRHAGEVRRDSPEMLEGLADLVRPTWPFRPEALTIGGGSSESLLLALKSVAAPGQVVAIEEPGDPRTRVILDRLGITGIPVACDTQGPRPEALIAALKAGPVAFLLQITGQVPLGGTLGPQRAAEIAEVIKSHPPLRIVECDWIGPIGTLSPVSLGRWFPDRTLLIRAFCKAFGTELRSNVIGGAAQIIAEIRRQRAEGLGVTSRILQGGLLALLSDQGVTRMVERARRRYRARGEALLEQLGRRGLDIAGPADGLFLRLPVQNEATAMLALAERGIIAAPGSRCFIEPSGQPFVSLSVTSLPDDPEAIAMIADALIKSLDYEHNIFRD